VLPKPIVDIPIPNYSQQRATFLDLFMFTDAVHVSGGFPTHHQEHVTVNTASVLSTSTAVLVDNT
jgi:hypothetical protein